MRVRRAQYWCSDCPGAFADVVLVEDYGVLLLRSQGAGTLAYVDTFADPAFDEVMDFVTRHLAGRPETDPGDLVQRLFGVTVDPDADRSAFVVGGYPPCPGCGEQTWWQVPEPPEFVELDIRHVTHHDWAALSNGERQRRLQAGVLTAPGPYGGRVLKRPSPPTHVDLYFPTHLSVDRDEIQDAIEADVGPVVRIVGAGTGKSGQNLDLEIPWPADVGLVLRALVGSLDRLQVPDETVVAISDPAEKLALGDLRRRSARSSDKLLSSQAPKDGA